MQGRKGLPNKGVDADGGDVVQSLNSGLDLVLGGADVADENKRLKWSERRGKMDSYSKMMTQRLKGECTLNSSIFFITTSEVRGYLHIS